MKLSKKIREFLEEELYSVSETVQDGRLYVEMEFYSDLGEDFIFTVDCDGTKSDFVKQFQEYATDFDPDEHAEMWVKARDSVDGVPHSVRALIDDADAIKERLEELAEKLSKL